MRLAAFGLAAVLSCTAMAAKRISSADPALDSLVRYRLPSNWVAEPGAVGKDEFLSFVRGQETIRIQLLGSKGSRAESVRDFMASPEARGQNSEPARPVRRRRVAAREVQLYRREWLRALGAAQGMDPGPTETVSEEFCIIPWGGNFFVLTYSVVQPEPPGPFKDNKVWSDFLESFRITRAADFRP